MNARIWSTWRVWLSSAVRATETASRAARATKYAFRIARSALRPVACWLFPWASALARAAARRFQAWPKSQMSWLIVTPLRQKLKVSNEVVVPTVPPPVPMEPGGGHQVAGRPAVAARRVHLGEQGGPGFVDAGVGGGHLSARLPQLRLVGPSDCQRRLQRELGRQGRVVRGPRGRGSQARKKDEQTDEQQGQGYAPHSYLSASMGSSREALRAG